MSIEIKSSTRVDLAGGTLDFWPIYLMVKDSLTINCSIDIFTQVSLEPSQSSEINVNVTNLQFEKTYAGHSDFIQSKDQEVALVQVVAEHFGDVGGYSITTRSESPVGGGLGGSSSLCISLINAFLEKTGRTIDLYKKVRLASNLEAKVLKTPTGCQDHFPPANPGLNVIHFKDLGPEVESIEFDYDYFSDRCFLVDTGKAHHSGINNWQVYKSVIEGDQRVIGALERVRDITHSLRDTLIGKKYDEVPKLFNEEFEARVELAECFSSPEIEKLKKIALNNGALSVKICGAGGGGCVLVMAPPELTQQVMDKCLEEKFQPLNIKFLGKNP